MNGGIHFLRHGQSMSDVGLGTIPEDGDIPLTALGRQQARQFAASLGAAPDLIFVSPRRRALETAAPIHARFPDTPSTVRPHLTEIVNFSLARFAGASFVERGRHELRYWATCDPDYCDGEDAESFVAFVERVKRELPFLAALRAGDVLVVCHGFFINMVRMLSADPRATARDLMPRFRPAWHDNPVPNTGVVTFDVENLQRLCRTVRDPAKPGRRQPLTF